MPIGYIGVNNGNGWKDFPSTDSPRNAANFNIVENGVKAVTNFANMIEAEVNAIVVGGTQVDPRVSQALVNASGHTFANLKEREDTNDIEVAKKATYYDLDSQSGIVLNFNKTEDAVIEISKVEGGAYQKVTTQGKNLLPYTAKTAAETINGITFTPNTDGTITLNGTSTAAASFYLQGYWGWSGNLFTLPVGSYILKAPGANGISINLSSGTNTLHVAQSVNTAFTLSQAELISFCHIYVPSGVTVTNFIIYPQLEVGTSSTAYEKFVPNSPSPDYPATISTPNNFSLVACGKNLFMANTLTAATDGVTVTKNSDGSYTLNGTSVSGGGIYTAGNAFYGSTILSVLKAGTYVLKGTGSSDVGVFIYLTGNAPAQQKNAYVNDTTIVFNADTALISFSIRWYAGVTFNNKKVYPQLELGSVATSFEPYKSNQLTIPYELVKLSSTVYDSIEKVDGVLKLIKRVGKVILNGSEAWSAFATNTAGIYRCIYTGMSTLIKKPTNAEIANLMCSHYKTTSADNTYQKIFGISIEASGNVAIYDSAYNTSDVSTFKTRLASSPMTVYYELATPVETTLDNLYLTSYPGISSVYTTAITSTNITGNAKSQLWNDMRIIKKQLTDLTNAVTLLGGQ